MEKMHAVGEAKGLREHTQTHTRIPTYPDLICCCILSSHSTAPDMPSVREGLRGTNYNNNINYTCTHTERLPGHWDHQGALHTSHAAWMQLGVTDGQTTHHILDYSDYLKNTTDPKVNYIKLTFIIFQIWIDYF